MKSIALVAAVLVVLGSPLARASSSASASIGPITIQLIDLDPSDGITPSITFLVSDPFHPEESLAFAQAYVDPFISSSTHRAVGRTPWQEVYASSTVDGVRATASLTGDVTPGASGATLAVAGSAADLFHSDPDAFAEYVTQANAGNYVDLGRFHFVLSDNTVAVFAGWGHVETSVASVLAAPRGARATGSASISVFGPPGGGGPNGNQSAFARIESVVEANAGNPADGEVLDRNLSVSFVNQSGGDLQGTFSVEVRAVGRTFAQPVPEPHPWMLFAGGLGLLAAVRRRLASRPDSGP